MPWNPETYNQFKNIRYQPFFDLKDLIVDENLRKCIDVGCGTGEQTHILSETFEDADFLGKPSGVSGNAQGRLDSRRSRA